jgi:hypothetical protein
MIAASAPSSARLSKSAAASFRTAAERRPIMASAST